MRERIGQMLEQIQREHDCRVLYACESGSRAWGFASPDSDFDVRFIYTHPLAWHLRLEPRRDTIELMTPDNLDLAGWELGKTLRLFASCNLALNEWLDSPEVYHAEPDFHRTLRELIPAYFNPIKALHHYRSMAENVAEPELNSETARIKKVFYVLRALLACRWIIDRGDMPPTRFDCLLQQQPLPDGLTAQIDELLARKALAAEGERVALHPTLAAWISRTREEAQQLSGQLPGQKAKDWEPLNKLMSSYVLGKQSVADAAAVPGVFSRRVS